jgi:hypothetical protein
MYKSICYTSMHCVRVRTSVQNLLLWLCCLLALMAHAHDLSAQTTYYSRQTGAWNSLTTWSIVSHTGAAAVSLPGVDDIVIVGNNHTITLNVSTTIRSLTIEQGTVQYDNAVPRTLTIVSTLTIAGAGSFTVQAVGGNIDNVLVLRGNVVNNGSWIFRPNPNSNARTVKTVFSSAQRQTVSGSGTTRLFRVEMDKMSVGNVLEVSLSLGVSAVGEGPALEAIDFRATGVPSGGTWRQTAGTLTIDDGVTLPRNQTIEVTGAMEIVGSASATFRTSLTITGGRLLVNTSGAVNIGENTGNSLLYSGADMGRFTLENGTVTVAGRLARGASASSNLIYTQLGGTLIVGNIGHSSASRGTFDMPTSGSSFTMTGGTLLIRNNNNSASRPADLNLTAAQVNTSGGTIAFSDGSSLAGEVFDYDVPPNAVFHTITVGSPSARLSPFSATQTLRIAGNLLSNGLFDASVTWGSAPAASSTVVFNGDNTGVQTVAGSGTIRFHNLWMNRSNAPSNASVGIVEVNRAVSIAGVLDLQEGGNPSPQILALGVGVDMTVLNGTPAAVIDGGATRYVRTSRLSGRLVRTLGGAGSYQFPLGSLGSPINPQETPAFATYSTTNGSATGQLAVRVAAGGNAVLVGGHAQLQASWDSYLRRVWQVQSSMIPLAVQGDWLFAYPDDASGAAVFLRLGRYRPNETTSGGTWQRFENATLTGTVPPMMPGTPPNLLPGTALVTGLTSDQLDGDWTLVETAPRIFYSRQSGDWRDSSIWAVNSHTGRPINLVPLKPQDSVIIGGGASGMGNHVVTLTESVTVSGVVLGYTSIGGSVTGTLDIQTTATLSGNHFAMGGLSTLRIGSPQGIAALPSQTGAIRTTQTRAFSTDGRYEYTGTLPQVFGNGLPAMVRSLWITKPSSVNLQRAWQTPETEPVLRATQNVVVRGDLAINAGILDMGSFSAIGFTLAPAVPTARFSLSTTAVLRIGGANSFADPTRGALRNYESYRIDVGTLVEFVGQNQLVDAAPDQSGYGFLSARRQGTKSVESTILVRRDFLVNDAATLNIRRDGTARILGNLYNNATILNEGILDIGQ